MIGGIRLKVCGLTSLVDADAADQCGADYLGFILYPKSPRYLPLAQYLALAPRIPPRRRVAVSVEPSLEDLGAMRNAGFDFFQVHFRFDQTATRLREWSDVVGAKRLWLAPQLPPGSDVSGEMLGAARSILLDTFRAGEFGGSGLAGDWAKFARHQTAHPDHDWILAGGLNPRNVGEALRQSGARIIDVNSGVERAPGVKDEALLKSLAEAMRRATGA